MQAVSICQTSSGAAYILPCLKVSCPTYMKILSKAQAVLVLSHLPVNLEVDLNLDTEANCDHAWIILKLTNYHVGTSKRNFKKCAHRAFRQNERQMNGVRSLRM